MPVRIYDIAKRLGLESKDVLLKAKELGIAAARVPSSSLDKITAEYLEEKLGGAKVAEVPAPARQVATNEDAVINWSLEGVTPDYFAEIDERRSRELGIKEKYIRKSLQHLIGESVKKIGKYDQQLRQMKDETDPKRLNCGTAWAKGWGKGWLHSIATEAARRRKARFYQAAPT